MPSSAFLALCAMLGITGRAVVAVEESNIQCTGGRKAVYSAHPGCEAGTCRVPSPVCESITTGWHCVCEKEHELFDTLKSTCVPAKTQACLVQHQPTSEEAQVLMFVDPKTCAECMRRQGLGENLACNTICGKPESTVMV